MIWRCFSKPTLCIVIIEIIINDTSEKCTSHVGVTVHKENRELAEKKNVIDIKIAMYVKDDQRESFISKEQVWWVLSLQLLTLSKFLWHNSHQNGNWSTTWRVWRSCFFYIEKEMHVQGFHRSIFLFIIHTRNTDAICCGSIIENLKDAIDSSNCRIKLGWIPHFICFLILSPQAMW